MPVEIKELIIRTHVTSGLETRHGESVHELSPSDKRKLVDACTKEVLRAMQKGNER